MQSAKLFFYACRFYGSLAGLVKIKTPSGRLLFPVTKHLKLVAVCICNKLYLLICIAYPRSSLEDPISARHLRFSDKEATPLLLIF